MWNVTCGFCIHRHRRVEVLTVKKIEGKRQCDDQLDLGLDVDRQQLTFLLRHSFRALGLLAASSHLSYICFIETEGIGIGNNDRRSLESH